MSIERLIAGLIALSTLLGGTTHADTIQVAVASNFMAPMKRIAEQFEYDTGHEVLASYGSSGKLFAQINHGAPYDVFLSADTSKPQQLIELKLATEKSRLTYAIGRLALLSGTQRDAKTQLEHREFSKLAIANPRVAPYGIAAQETLSTLGLWETARTQIVRGESIAQTYQFVASGNAQLGFVAASQLIINGKLPEGAWLVPSDYHKAIEQDAVLLTRTDNAMIAQLFLNYLQGPRASAIIQEFGYDIVSTRE